MGVFFPFSIRQPAKELKNLEVTNDVTMIIVDMPIRKDVQTALPPIKKLTGNLKNSLAPFSF